MVTEKPKFSWRVPNYLIFWWRRTEQIVVTGWRYIAHILALLPLWIILSSIPWCVKNFRLFLLWIIFFFFFFWNVQFLGKPCHVIPFTLHSSFLCLFWTKWSPVRSKTSSVAQRKRSTPRLFSPMFIFLPALFESGPFCQGYNFAKWISVNIMSCLFAQVEHERWEIVKWNQSTR